MKLHLYLFAVALLLTSCSSYYYLPTKQNVMVFKQKGDAILSGNLGLFYQQSGLEAGYSFTDNIGFYSSFNKFNISHYGNTHQFIKDFIWDNELIIYKKFDFGLYTALNTGVGIGKLNVGNPYYDLTLHRQFVQPTLGFIFMEIFEFGLSTRFTLLNYKLKSIIDNQTNYDQIMFNNYFDFGSLNKENHFFIEPALTMGLNFEFINLKCQYTVSKEIGRDAYFYIPENLTTSISFNLGKIFFKQNDSNKKLRWTL